MFSYDDRKRAVELLIKYKLKCTATIRKLGYPKDRRTIKKWYDEYVAGKEYCRKRKGKNTEVFADIKNSRTGNIHYFISEIPDVCRVEISGINENTEEHAEEENPNTGAPVFLVPAIIAIAAAVIGKRK